jgi:nucleotide-binding universal stress UspA family protein
MRILTALDRSEYAEIVLEHALDAAMREGANAVELDFVTVIRDEAEREAAEAWLDAAVREGLDEFDLTATPYTLHVRRGAPAPAIGALATEIGADLVVIGRFDVPSVSELLVQIIDRPTMVVGMDGVVLEPQCSRCREVRRESGGERWFCDDHHSERMPDLSIRVPPSTQISSRMW